MSNGDAAATCPVGYGQYATTPQGRAGPQKPPKVVDIAAVPTARDLISAITAINQMNHIVQHITRGTPQINNTYGPNIRFSSSPPDRDRPEYQPVRWKQITRDYHDDEVVNPDNEKQRVQIKTIKRNIWQEDSTEQRVVYKGRQ
jgi:hypothetical protein